MGNGSRVWHEVPMPLPTPRKPTRQGAQQRSERSTQDVKGVTAVGTEDSDEEEPVFVVCDIAQDRPWTEFMCAAGADDGQVFLWKVEEIKTRDGGRSVLTGHTSTVFAVKFSPSGSTLATGSRNGEIRVWDTKTVTFVALLSGNRSFVNSLSFSSDSSKLASGGGDKCVFIWTISTGSHLRCGVGDGKEATGHKSMLKGVLYSKDNRLVLSWGIDPIAHLWDGVDGTSRGMLEGHTNTISSAVFSPNSAKIMTASYDGSCRIWNVDLLVCEAVFTGANEKLTDASFLFAPSGKVVTSIATASLDGHVRVFDVESQRMLVDLRGADSDSDSDSDSNSDDNVGDGEGEYARNGSGRMTGDVTATKQADKRVSGSGNNRSKYLSLAVDQPSTTDNIHNYPTQSNVTAVTNPLIALGIPSAVPPSLPPWGEVYGVAHTQWRQVPQPVADSKKERGQSTPPSEQQQQQQQLLAWCADGTVKVWDVGCQSVCWEMTLHSHTRISSWAQSTDKATIITTGENRRVGLFTQNTYLASAFRGEKEVKEEVDRRSSCCCKVC